MYAVTRLDLVGGVLDTVVGDVELLCVRAINFEHAELVVVLQFESEVSH